MTATKQLIRVGHSPDPDDAFMFYALANDQLDTGDYEFTHELVDIETLNRRAFAADLELTAVSIHAYAYLHDKYMLCTCGASMGDGYGPMVVSRKPMTTDELRGCRIAVPGKAHQRVSCTAAVFADRFRVPRSAVRSNHSCSRRRRIRGPADRRGADHSRRPANVWRAATAADRRSGQMVEGPDRFATAAGGECGAKEFGHAKRPGKFSGC